LYFQSGVVGAVHGDVHVDVVALFPLDELVFIEQHARVRAP
jgi:hypothetical protein